MSGSTVDGGGSSVTGGSSVAGGGSTVAGATAGGATQGGAAATVAGGASTVSGGTSTTGGGGRTALSGDSTVAGATNQTAAWRDDWRDAMATINGEVDPKIKRALDRYQTPEAVVAAHMVLRQRLDSGDLTSKLPKDAKPEEIAAWRKDNGIPEKPEGYLEALPNGLVIGDADKPGITKFVTAMHGQNASPAMVGAALGQYYALREAAAADRAEADGREEMATTDALRLEWGADFRGNMNAIHGLLDSAPAGLKDKLANARMPDGSAMMNDQSALRWFGALAREINPASTVVPGAGGNAGKGVDDRIGEIEKVMRTDRRAYDKDTKMQAELRDLYDARERFKARAA